MWIPGSGAFSLVVVYETSRTQIGSSRRPRPWKLEKSRSDNQRPCERAQKERIGRRSTGSCEKGACEALSCEVSPREGNEETDCVMERRLAEVWQPGPTECGFVSALQVLASRAGLVLIRPDSIPRLTRVGLFSSHARRTWIRPYRCMATSFRR